MSDLSSSESSETSGRPNRLWQWLLLYPSLAIAVFTAVPEWINAGVAFSNGLKPSQLPQATTQSTFWERNLKCTESVFEWVENPQNVRVDGTICPSGDIMVRIEVPSKNGAYKGSIRGILIDDILKQVQNASLPFVSTAHAATNPAASLSAPSIRARANRLFAQSSQFAVVVCQKYLADKRTIKRHVKVSGKCFDEYVDTYTGNIKRREQTSCRGGCG